MKLKYYLRGLGIGIVVSVFILTVAFSNRKPMTDAEIKERAAELGMIENSVLTDRNDIANEPDDTDESNNTDNTDVETPNQDNTNLETDGSGKEDSDSEISDMTPPDANESDANEPDDTTNTEETEQNKDTNTISITVVSGDSSWTVSQRMEKAGLIESAKDFDTHLCRYGYDKKISVGTYLIPKDATHEEMAKILTRMD